MKPASLTLARYVRAHYCTCGHHVSVHEGWGCNGRTSTGKPCGCKELKLIGAIKWPPKI